MTDKGFAFSDSTKKSHGGKKEPVATGSFLGGQYTKSNFGHLRIKTSMNFSDEEQVYAAGYLEGYLTAPGILQNWQNMDHYFTGTLNASFERPMAWLQEQDDWLRGECISRGHTVNPTVGGRAPTGAYAVDGGDTTQRNPDRWWASVCLVIKQFDGLIAGYYAAAEGNAGFYNKDDLLQMTPLNFLALESNGDLYDIIEQWDPSERPSWSVDGSTDPEELFDAVALSGKCSALVKVTKDDVFMSHATWDTYTAALRIYKHYEIHLHELEADASKIAFSSYPGQLFSDDDFFIMDSGLVMLQTTNKLFDPRLFTLLSTKSVLSWQRVRAAHWISKDGKEWTENVARENSGTYNNQYLVVDLNKFTPGEADLKSLEPGLLWVAEQIPGRVESEDLTDILRQTSYFASYNVPFFPDIYAESGYPDYKHHLEKFGQNFTKTTHWLSHELAPRAKIFNRDQANITTLEDLKRIMRSNGYARGDPFSEGHPLAAVCGRGDLMSGSPLAKGCYDCKVTSATLAKGMQAEAVNGPTIDGGDLPPFTWKPFNGALHKGQPETFHFEFERMTPEEDDYCMDIVNGMSQY